MGWVLGRTKCGGPDCLVIRATVDGGATWTAKGAPGAVPKEDLQAIRFANSNDGWLFGRALWATHDGGDHWHPVIGGPSPSFSVLTLEASAGFVHVIGLNTGAGPSIQILVSPVGSDAFTLSPTTLEAGGGPAPAVSLVLHDKSGWLVANNRGAVAAARLINGSWHRASTPCPGDASLAALSSTAVFAACTEGVWTGPAISHVAYMSVDGGQTYRRIGTKLPVWVESLASPTPTTVFVSGGTDRGIVIDESTDSGRSWTAVRLEKSAGFVQDLGFTTPTQGAAVVGVTQGPNIVSTLLMTNDGGHHWHTVNLGP
jgi:hypothetical protein